MALPMRIILIASLPPCSMNCREELCRTASFARQLVGGRSTPSLPLNQEARSPVFNAYTSSFDYMGDVPDQTCNANLSKGDRTFTRYFNTDCYIARHRTL